MLDMMRTTIEHNLLKYSAGHHIFCPKCDTVADWRKWIIVERVADGATIGACCTACFDAHMADNAAPSKYRVIRHAKPAKPAKTKLGGLPSKKGPLNTALRKDIFTNFKRLGYYTKTDKLFPDGYGHGVELVETIQPDGDVNVWWKGDPHYSAHQINEYVRKFCELNHLAI